MFNDIYVYVPDFKQIVKITEGTGDNLLEEDIDAGYVDYTYYEQYALEPDFPEVDGGMILLTTMFRELYKSTKDAIPSVLDMAYGDESLHYILLE